MSEEQSDPINKPSHYIAGPYECATVARAVFGDWAWAVHCRITAWTYLWRAGKKGSSQEDVAKAARYLAWAADIDDRRSELHRSEFDQMETDLAMSRQNEETLKGEIARLKKQLEEAENRFSESNRKVFRLEVLESSQRVKLEQQARQIQGLECDREHLKQAAKKRVRK
jgi:chromosome segregation ATPase